MNSKELCALKNSALHKQPHKVATASKMMSKIKREYGVELWQTLNAVIASNNPPLWFSTMVELIKNKVQEEQAEDKIEKEKIERSLAKKRKLEMEASKITENLFRIPPTNIPRPSTVVRRRV